ncbi:hypothetical protein QAD02_000787 [Eretmocerus hayati]|uniref:Uncharacterized protein n=1 Tax=Eretmocerus hayati TaxID=131215 RepID=A0ACC2NFF9_9HYME|nr:hypothetical protein QAD02_000787 [Eretmocerus hayati]
MGSPTPADLRVWLKGKDPTLDEETLDILEDQGIDLLSFMDLSQKDLLEVKVRLGPAKKLIKIINILNMPMGDLSLDDSSDLTSRREVEVAPTTSDKGNCHVLDMDVGLPNTVPVQNQPGKKLARVQTSNSPAVPSEPVSNANDRGSKRKRVSQNETLTQPTNRVVGSSKRQKLNSDSCVAVHSSSASVAVEAPLATGNLQYTRHGTLEQTLKRRSQGGAALVNKLKTIPSPSDKRGMIRILVDELTECTGSCYPKPEVKTALAKRIVTEFPLLRHPRGFGYQHFFDPVTRRHGSIETRLWTVRKDLPPEEKKNKVKSKSKDDDNTHHASHAILTPQELEKKKSWMKLTLANKQNKDDIKDCLGDTFDERRTWVLTKGPSVSEIYAEYPQIFEYEGEMMDDEFERIHPKSAKRYKEQFPTYFVPRILAYAKALYKNIYEDVNDKYNLESDAFKALYILKRLLPSYNRKKNTTSNDETQQNPPSSQKKIHRDPLIELVPGNNSIQKLMVDLRKGRKIPLQPYLIRAGSRKPTYFVDADGLLFKKGGRVDIVLAFDLLFKSYQVLDVAYPSELENFYIFVSCHIYGIAQQETDSVASLFTSLHNFNMEAFRNS